MSLNILNTCFLDNVWILKGEVIHQSLLGVKGLSFEVGRVYWKEDFVGNEVHGGIFPKELFGSQ